MASWWTPAGEQLQSDKFRDSYFTIGLPPELTFTTPDCPHRMPRSDDEDELRKQTETSDELRPFTDDSFQETPRKRRDECQ
jgi:hypothetical protein